ncbi:PfkB family carbohydrate kinase, partial [Staphylococcus aureus]|uniref:PfkB family carbohydrate kinase n=1 Tax=Staphylococcus aureus TaxID=1280 RepID=UPI003D20C162
MSSGRVIVVGSVNLDVVYRVPHLPRPGETLIGADLVRLSGGKGGNQAHAAARVAPAGAPVAMVACVGDDDAAGRLRDDLAGAGVDTDGVRRVDGPSGTALIAVDDAGENTIVVIPGANAA